MDVYIQSALVGGATIQADFTTKISASLLGFTTIQTNDFQYSKYITINTTGIGVVKVTADIYKFNGLSAKLNVKASLDMFNYDRDIRETMDTYFPKYYSTFDMVQKLKSVYAYEFTRLNATILDTLKQFNIGESTWGLDTYENHLGLSTQSDMTLDERRNRVNRLMIGRTATLDNLQASMSRPTTIIERDNFTIDIITTETNMFTSDAYKFFRRIVPAHIKIHSFIYKLKALVHPVLKSPGGKYFRLDNTDGALDTVEVPMPKVYYNQLYYVDNGYTYKLIINDEFGGIHTPQITGSFPTGEFLSVSTDAHQLYFFDVIESGNDSALNSTLIEG